MPAARFFSTMSSFLAKSRPTYVNSVRFIRQQRTSEQAAAAATRTEMVPDRQEEDFSRITDFFGKVNQDISQKQGKGRLFAICHLYGQQHIFSEGDTIMVLKKLPAEIGARLKLEKCMLVGGENVTLVGRPVLDRDLVHIEATLIETTLSHTRTSVLHVPRASNYSRWSFIRKPLSVLRINEIRICHNINESQDAVQ